MALSRRQHQIDALFRIIDAGDDPPQLDPAVQPGHVGEHLRRGALRVKYDGFVDGRHFESDGGLRQRAV